MNSGKVNAVVIDPRGTTPVATKIWPWPYLPDIQRHVGGYVELFYPGATATWHAYVAENAQQRRLPYNALATKLAQRSYPTAPALYGTVLIVGTGFKGTDIDAPTAVLRSLGLA